MSEKLLPRLLGDKRPGLGFHSFRHGMATMLRNAGVDMRTADRILGHTSEGMGARYGEFHSQLLAEAIGKIALPSAVAGIPARS